MIDASEDMTNCPVLAACIHALKNNEELFTTIDEEALLQVTQALMDRTKCLFSDGFFGGHVRSRIRVDLSKLDWAVRANPVAFVLAEAHNAYPSNLIAFVG